MQVSPAPPSSACGATVASLRCCRAPRVHVFFDRRPLNLHALSTFIAWSCRRIVASHQLILAFFSLSSLTFSPFESHHPPPHHRMMNDFDPSSSILGWPSPAILRNIALFAGMSTTRALSQTSKAYRMIFLGPLRHLGCCRGEVEATLLCVPQLPRVLIPAIVEQGRPSRIMVIKDRERFGKPPFMPDLFERGIVAERPSVSLTPPFPKGRTFIQIRADVSLQHHPCTFNRHDMDIFRLKASETESKRVLGTPDYRIWPVRPDAVVISFDVRGRRPCFNILHRNCTHLRRLFGDDIPIFILIANSDMLDERSKHHQLMNWVRDSGHSYFGDSRDGLVQLFGELDRTITTRRTRRGIEM